MKNLVIGHGGAPTAVINASLYGAIKELRKEHFSGKIYACRFGSAGLYKKDLINLTNLTDEDLEELKKSSGSAIGTSRFPLYDKEYEQIVDNLIDLDIGYVLFTGGNGSMDTIGNIYKHAKNRGVDIDCVGIPKTIDNDIGVTDHAPGFASCAKYIAQTVSDCWQDVRSLPIHVSVMEVMGRNAGWLAASSALARKGDNDAPQIICFPEIPFDEKDFLDRVDKAYKKGKGVIVVTSESLHYKDGTPIVAPVFRTERAIYYGETGEYLAELIIKKLGIKSRSEKPGLICRSSMTLFSEVDRKEAILMGKTAAKAVLNHKNGVMAGIKRISNNPYKIKPILIPIEKVMLTEATFPLKYIDKSNHYVTQEFIDWLKPLVGEIHTGVSYVENKKS